MSACMRIKSLSTLCCAAMIALASCVALPVQAAVPQQQKQQPSRTQRWEKVKNVAIDAAVFLSCVAAAGALGWGMRRLWERYRHGKDERENAREVNGVWVRDCQTQVNFDVPPLRRPVPPRSAGGAPNQHAGARAGHGDAGVQHDEPASRPVSPEPPIIVEFERPNDARRQEQPDGPEEDIHCED